MFPSLIASANTAMHDRTFSDVEMLSWPSRNFLAPMTAITVQALLPMEMPKIVDCAIWCGRSQSVTLSCVLILQSVLPVDPTVSGCDVDCACLGQTLLAQMPSLQWGHWTSLFLGNLWPFLGCPHFLQWGFLWTAAIWLCCVDCSWMFLGCCGTSSGMDGGGGGGDNAKIPLLMDCISSFKLLSFVVSLSDASSSSFVMDRPHVASIWCYMWSVHRFFWVYV